MKYVSFSIRACAVTARAEAAGCKTSPYPTCLSLYLLLALHNQTDRPGVPAHLPCLRAKHQGFFFLMNEVAISYCSVKRACQIVCVPQMGRKEQVNARIGLPQRKDGLEKDGKEDTISRSCAVRIVGVVYVKILEKVSSKWKGNGGEEA